MKDGISVFFVYVHRQTTHTSVVVPWRGQSKSFVIHIEVSTPLFSASCVVTHAEVLSSLSAQVPLFRRQKGQRYLVIKLERLDHQATGLVHPGSIVFQFNPSNDVDR